MCVKCGDEKPQSEYYANDKSCKECRKALVRANRASKVEQYREYDRRRFDKPERVIARAEWKQTEAGKQSKAKTSKKYRLENPKKYAAHLALNNAVRDGIITKRTDCEECGETYYIEGHHDDYDKPLEVRWLCAGCHTSWHDLNGEALNG